MRLSVQATPYSDAACEVPPTPSTSTDAGNRLRTSRAPSNGVAESKVSLSISMAGDAAPLTVTGVPDAAGQVRHGALYQALFQVMNGALACVAQLSVRQVSQFFGHAA